MALVGTVQRSKLIATPTARFWRFHRGDMHCLGWRKRRQAERIKRCIQFILPILWTKVDCDDRDAVLTGTMALVGHNSKYAWSSLAFVKGTGWGALLAACESSWYVSLHILREAQARLKPHLVIVSSFCRFSSRQELKKCLPRRAVPLIMWLSTRASMQQRSPLGNAPCCFLEP